MPLSRIYSQQNNNECYSFWNDRVNSLVVLFTEELFDHAQNQNVTQ